MLIQALAHLTVRIAQAIQRPATHVFFRQNGQIAGLEQQRLGGDVVHVERRQQFPGAHRLAERHRGDPTLEQGLHQERWRRGLEPVGVELAAVEQQEHVVGIVYLLRATPAVAVVPVADRRPVQAVKLGRKHGVQVRFRVAADRRVAAVQGDVLEVVETGEQADLGELADAGEEGEADVRVRKLDVGVQAAQIVAVGARQLRRLQRVQNRLVVFVDQHHHTPTRLAMQRFQQETKALGA